MLTKLPKYFYVTDEMRNRHGKLYVNDMSSAAIIAFHASEICADFANDVPAGRHLLERHASALADLAEYLTAISRQRIGP